MWPLLPEEQSLVIMAKDLEMKMGSLADKEQLTNVLQECKAFLQAGADKDAAACREAMSKLNEACLAIQKPLCFPDAGAKDTIVSTWSLLVEVLGEQFFVDEPTLKEGDANKCVHLLQNMPDLMSMEEGPQSKLAELLAQAAEWQLKFHKHFPSNEVPHEEMVNLDLDMAKVMAIKRAELPLADMDDKLKQLEKIPKKVSDTCVSFLKMFEKKSADVNKLCLYRENATKDELLSQMKQLGGIAGGRDDGGDWYAGLPSGSK